MKQDGHHLLHTIISSNTALSFTLYVWTRSCVIVGLIGAGFKSRAAFMGVLTDAFVLRTAHSSTSLRFSTNGLPVFFYLDLHQDSS